MDDTKKWIKRELPRMGAFSVTRVKADDRSSSVTEKFGIEKADLADCRLSISRTTDYPTELTYTETVTLKDVDVTKVRAVEQFVQQGYTHSRPSYYVTLMAALDRGEPFTSQVKQPGYSAQAVRPARQVLVRVGEEGAAKEGADVLRRAALLCGAPAQPVVPVAAPPELVAQLVALEQEAGELSRRGDKAGIEKMLDPGFSGTFNGQAFSRTSFLSAVKAQPDIVSSVIESPVVRMVGDRAVVSGTLVVQIRQGSETVVGRQRFTDEFVQKDGRWLVVKTAIVQLAGTQPAVPTKPAATVSSNIKKMTNDDVIQLVAAGLAEQVVSTSIRQAPAKDFDLTTTGLIALKKAGVSDAVIVVMQEKPAPAQAATTNDVKAPPKYDATLEPKKPAAPDNGCSTIENLGVYQNQLMSRGQSQGGLVEWLVKIRNNAAVTKMVTIGWINEYGEQKKGEVEIRGGDIATLRLDLTSAKFIPPVKDVKLVSCR